MAYPFPYYGQPMQYQDQLSQLRGGQMPPVQQPAFMQRQENNGLLWVQGEAGAKSWFVAPGSTVLLMDSESQRFYLKSADPSGVPTMRTFEYTEVGTAKPAAPMQAQSFVTMEEFASFKNEVMGRLEGQQKGVANE